MSGFRIGAGRVEALELLGLEILPANASWCTIGRSFLQEKLGLETDPTTVAGNRSIDLAERERRMRYSRSATFFVKFEGNVCQYSLPSLSSNFFLSDP